MTEHMPNIQTVVVSVFFVMQFIGNTPSYSDAAGINAGQTAVLKADNKSLEPLGEIEDTGEAHVFRMSMDGYIVVNTTLLLKKIRKALELQFSIFNLFDKDYTYPSAPNSTPGDYPAQGRSFVLCAKYGF